MNLYILDTDHVTLHQHNHPQVIVRMKLLAKEQIVTTAITVEEQMRGRLAQFGQAGSNLPLAYNLLVTTTEYFCDLTILPFDSEAERQFQSLRSQKIRIGTLDLRIAAIASVQNATLVTRNQRDFGQVPGLRLENWS